MNRSLRDGTALMIASAVLAACGPNAAHANAGNTSADTAHIAARATEPRTGDVTAARPAAPLPAASGTSQIAAGSTSAPAPTSTAADTSPAAPAAPPAAAKAATVAAPPKKIIARHVLIQWMGSDRAGKSVLRTREQALVLAQEVLKRANAGEDLGRLAVEYSDEPNAGARGGSLGRFGKGQMVGAFEDAAFKLEVGQISGIVETPFGFHVIQRTE